MHLVEHSSSSSPNRQNSAWEGRPQGDPKANEVLRSTVQAVRQSGSLLVRHGRVSTSAWNALAKSWGAGGTALALDALRIRVVAGVRRGGSELI